MTVKDIVLLFAKEKGIVLRTRFDYGSFFARNGRAAKQLQEYDRQTLIDIMLWLKENADYNWGLESVKKRLDTIKAEGEAIEIETEDSINKIVIVNGQRYLTDGKQLKKL